MPEQDSFVSLAEAAALKGVHYQTVRRAIARGDLPALKVGRGVIIAATDVAAWQPKSHHAPHEPYRRSQQGKKAE